MSEPAEPVKIALCDIAKLVQENRGLTFKQSLAAIQDAAAPEPPVGTDIELFLCDRRPKVQLPGADRLVSDFAKDLAVYLRDKDIFTRNNEVVTIRMDNGIEIITADSFRTMIEKHIICYAVRGKDEIQINVTMGQDAARAVLASVQFKEGLRTLRAVYAARLPIIRPDGQIELLPVGYDDTSNILTRDCVAYPETMDIEEAKKIIDDLLAEFCFADAGRSKAVAIAATVGLFAQYLMQKGSLRPVFILLANAEGAGKTLLVCVCIMPVLGSMPAGSRPEEEAEMQKVLLTAIREGRQVVFLDNIRGRLASASLEGFTSASSWTGRLLGLNQSFKGDNLATVFITGNGLTVTPDMRRRTLFVELHLEMERAEDRVFKRRMDQAFLMNKRPEILGALWSMVQNWDKLGRPGPSRSHSAFPEWAQIVGGIVEAAGYDCAFQTAEIEAAGDVDGQDMRALVQAMGEDLLSERSFSQLVDLAVERGLFEQFVDGEGLNQKTRTAFSRMLVRYDKRLFGTGQLLRFRVEGKGRARKFKVERIK